MVEVSPTVSSELRMIWVASSLTPYSQRPLTDTEYLEEAFLRYIGMSYGEKLHGINTVVASQGRIHSATGSLQYASRIHSAHCRARRPRLMLPPTVAAASSIANGHPPATISPSPG
jgi:hypothetical protein